MKQRTMNFKTPYEKIDTNVYRIAFEMFTKRHRPSNLELAMKDPVFKKLLKARATQLVKDMKKAKHKERAKLKGVKDE